MTNFEKITASPEALGEFLASPPVATGPWDEEFHRAFCDSCERENCDEGRCPNQDKRYNLLWWLTLGEKAGAVLACLSGPRQLSPSYGAGSPGRCGWLSRGLADVPERGTEKSIREDKRRLEKAKKRLADVDKLITHIYEDMVLGSLSQERYQKMLEGYEAEQAALNNEVIGLEDWVATREEMEDNVDQFLALMEKYVDIPELTTTIVNEFIKQIIVYASDKSSGKRTQKVKIVFIFLEEVEVPEISEPVITQTTGRRKTA